MRRRYVPEPELEPLNIRWKYFMVFFFLLMTNLISASVVSYYFPPLQYMRQPALVVLFFVLVHKFPVQPEKPGFQIAVRVFVFFCLYLIFNAITSLNIANTLMYSSWMVAFYVFFYQFLVLRNELRFREILFQFVAASGIVGGILIIGSYIAGYGFRNDFFWDKRFNYTLMTLTYEFAGIYGSNNAFGMLTFVTAFFMLMLFELNKGTKLSYLFLGTSVFLTFLLFSIGNRASMSCGLVFWLLYFIWVYRSVIATFVLVTGLFFGFVTFNEVIIPKLRLEQFEGGNILGNRASLFNEALAVADEMDFFGVGYHNQRLSRKYFGLVREDDKEYNFHNTYLAMLTEFGYFGFIWIPGIILVLLLKSSQYNGGIARKRQIRMLKCFILVMLVLYLPVEDSINSPGSPIFIFFWSTFFILGIGLFEKAADPAIQNHEEKNRLSDHTVQPG